MRSKYDDQSLYLPSDRTLSERAERISGPGARDHGDPDAQACAGRRDSGLKQRLDRMCLFGSSRGAVLARRVEPFAMPVTTAMNRVRW